ncbi:uncharacterized protein PHACADRAFT_250061 [Phanerochaete carnosa HHB-10118-sp]|uniref:Bromo domain-containing protein n=1 Tax=Phanerochaete carnosa (strain HHB-10118-sp) TaxID=650164 RepID=K5W6F8_PHACS|nr:uncharacterized protein PHACADRAFT_250061 [Phanerochaete carnosa HHB-10118-sp]EKM59508.1 hypothetical protein PHACADRAFT_250061 [Phanerochaete carnosa HHB-10118-sp]
MATAKRVREIAMNADSWSTVERLILSQAIYEFGTDNMPQVATLLESHAMISRPHNFFTVETCSTVYEKLMEESNIPRPDTAYARAPELKQLATIYYQKRTGELKNAIEEDENKFKRIVKEIDEIRAGQWDDRIRQSLGIAPDSVNALESPREEKTAEENICTDDVSPTTAAVDAPEAHTPSTSRSRLPSPQRESRSVTAEPEQPGQPEQHGQQEEPEEAPPEVSMERPASEEVPDMEAEADAVVEKAEDMDVQPTDEEIQPQEPEEPEAVEAVETPEAFGEERSPVREESPVAAHVDFQVQEDVDTAESPEAEISLREAVGKRKASEVPSEAARDRKRQREDSEAVEEEEPGPSTIKGRRKNQGAADKKFQNVINMLHSSISQHRYGNIFHNPIKKQDAADYHDIVKRPTDLKTIKARVKDGTISNALEFQRDIYLMFANAMIYNRPGSEIHAMAEEMMLESEAQIQQFRRTQVQIEQLRNTDAYPRM